MQNNALSSVAMSEIQCYADSFSPLVGSVFAIETTMGAIPLRLEEIIFKEMHNLGPYHCYILIFSGPAEIFFHEGTYRMEQDRMGSLEIHIAPCRVTETGYLYQAIFSILKEGAG